MKKKLLSLFVAAVMVFSMLPLGVFAAPDAPSVREVDDPEVIDTIEILDFAAPAWGANPFFDLTVPEDANYSISFTVWHWYTQEDYGYMEETDTFNSEETRYYVRVEIVPDEGYTFSDDTVASINGDTTIVEELRWDDAESRFYVVTFSFTVEEFPPPEYVSVIEINDLEIPAWGASPDFEVWGYANEGGNELIDEISIIGMTEPVFGEAPDCEAEPEDSDAPYTVIFVNWYCNGELMESDAVFDDPTAEYHAEILLMAGIDDEFAEDSTIYVNGSEENIISAEASYSSLLIKWGYFTVEPKILIEDINVIGMTEPVFGEAPDCEAQPVNSDDPYTVSLVEWYCDDELMEEGALFDNADAEYHAIIYLYANEGYEFAEVPAVLVNGSDEFVVESAPFNENAAFGIVWGNFTVEQKTIIDEVSIIGMTEPVLGEAPDCEAEPEDSDAPYTVIFVNWYCNGELMDSEAVFNDLTAEYHAEILLMAGIDDEFAEDPTIYVNGSEENIISAEASYSSLLIKWGYFTIEPEIIIDEISIIGMTEPVFGEAPDCEAEPEDSDAPYDVISVNWYCNGEPMDSEAVFDDPTAEYHAVIFLITGLNDEFAEDPTVYVNGSEENIIGFDPNGNSIIIQWGYFTVEPEVVLIDEVNVEGFIEPAWGAAPFYGVTVPEGANYTIELVEWYDNNAIGAMAPTDVFDNEDTTYSIYVEIVPDEGYEFSESLVMLINGEETFVDPEYSAASAEGAYIWSIEFTVERELIDAIEITELDIPEWGTNPDFEVVVPEGAPYGIHYVIWYLDGDEPTELGAGSMFDDAAAEYFVEIRIDAADGYKFADSVTATLNDGTELILSNEVDTEENCVYVESIRFTVEAPIIWGDADGDGELTTADALLLMRYLIGTDTVADANLELCDVNGDGKIDLVDALLIMRKAMGSIECFPVEE